MTRPALRPMRALPTLERRRAQLETCTFCPKLCRSACPVSNEDPRETVTPWGKMAAAWMAAHGDTPATPEHAASAWACTGCLACRESCDHRNPVADVLLDARDAQRGVAPEGARRVLAGFAGHEAKTREAARALDPLPVRAKAARSTALLVGCGYLRRAPAEARDALAAARALSADPVSLVDRCCGLPLRLAGDGARFEAHARSLARELAPFEHVLVVDAGCAHAIRRMFPAAGASIGADVELLVEAASRRLDALRPVPVEGGEPIRWHDPCRLGRGLGIYDEPRRVLAKATGRAVGELRDARRLAPCSGAGGLLPSTMPDVARGIATTRLEEHRASGGGRVVTGCASSLSALRKRAAGSGVAIDDVVTYIARSLQAGRL
jgi:dimethylglycine catabolism B